MKRFYKQVTVGPDGDAWRILLDGRGIKTPQRAPQLLPTRPLAEALAQEWADQGDELNPAGFVMRDMADYAIDVVGIERPAAITNALSFAETDTLCYRTDPDQPLFQRQQDLWEPLLTAAENRHGVSFQRVSGVIHRPQPQPTLDALRALLEMQDAFTLAALANMASLAASLVVALAALEEDADAGKLWAAANCEEDWQAEQWGWEWTAEALRAKRLSDFTRAMHFAHLVRGG